MEQGAAGGGAVPHAPVPRPLRTAVQPVHGVGEQRPVRLAKRGAWMAVALPLDRAAWQPHLDRRSAARQQVQVDRQPALVKASVYLPVLTGSDPGDGRHRGLTPAASRLCVCLLYTSDAADE